MKLRIEPETLSRNHDRRALLFFLSFKIFIHDDESVICQLNKLR